MKATPCCSVEQNDRVRLCQRWTKHDTNQLRVDWTHTAAVKPPSWQRRRNATQLLLAAASDSSCRNATINRHCAIGSGKKQTNHALAGSEVERAPPAGRAAKNPPVKESGLRCTNTVIGWGGPVRRRWRHSGRMKRCDRIVAYSLNSNHSIACRRYLWRCGVSAV